MIEFGQILTLSNHFKQHYEYQLPVQVLKRGIHVDIGNIRFFDKYFVEIEGTLYNQQHYTFISRSGY